MCTKMVKGKWTEQQTMIDLCHHLGTSNKKLVSHLLMCAVQVLSKSILRDDIFQPLICSDKFCSYAWLISRVSSIWNNLLTVIHISLFIVYRKEI
nr:hypothetical protein CFP56_62273 [Quercus suber]